MVRVSGLPKLNPGLKLVNTFGVGADGAVIFQGRLERTHAR